MQDIQFQWKEWEFRADGERVSIGKEGVRLAEFGVAPLVEGRPTEIGPWRKVEDSHFAADLDIGGSVHLAVEHGHACYWMETDREQFDRLIYFPDSRIESCGWQTYVSDEYDGFWDMNLDKTVPISSAYADIYHPDVGDGAGMTDPGDKPLMWIFNMPPRVLSFKIGDTWLGMSLPGALPVGVTRPRVLDGVFSLSFEAYRPACCEGQGPKVYFVTGLTDRYDLLDEHRVISENMGLTVRRSADHPEWWANPFYDYWDELIRWQKAHPEMDQAGRILTPERWRGWLDTVKESVGSQKINTNLEQYCYRWYGDYRPVPELGTTETMRDMIDQLRASGTHISWYIHPFLVNKKCDFYQEHPEAFCTPRDENYRFTYALERGEDDPEYALVDWTHPLGREWMLGWVDYLISDRPGCLNVDILRSNHWRGPDPRLYQFHDPDWGIGDRMSMKVQQLMYERAKACKPDCMVSKVGAGDCYMQPWADVDYLCEEWNGYTANWYRRSRIATRLMHDTLFITDPYFVTITKGYEFYMGMLSWQTPATSSVEHAIHPYMYHRELGEKDYRRRRAGFQVYFNAPANITDQCSVELGPEGEPSQRRKYTQGPLAGFYAGLAISSRCFVTYSEEEARIASSETRRARIPLPPKAEVIAVERVPHEGKISPHDFDLVHTEEGDFVNMRVADSGGEAMYFRIRYRLAPC
ncbi:MAG: hypothetical protein KAJ81_03025 [Candidatus Latescibacteria bacterium]|nr:hypothetical protein [Candidatus Latescibacterota bacterium]